MWLPEGDQIANDSLGALIPEDVLYEYEEPLTFVCRDRDGQLLLAHSLSAEGGVSRYLVVRSDQRNIDDLRAGRVDVLGALRQPQCWIVDFGPGWDAKQLWLIAFENVPRETLPGPGTTLTPELEPIFASASHLGGRASRKPSST
jgi:hypothetical protein